MKFIKENWFKIGILFILLLSVVLVGSMIFLPVIGQQKLDLVQKNQKDDLFNKNLECQKLRSTTEKIFKSYDIYSSGGSLIELFYSPLLNSCVFSFTHSTINAPIKDESLARQYFKLYDIFSSKLLVDMEAKYKDGNWDNTSELFEGEVNKYK